MLSTLYQYRSFLYWNTLQIYCIYLHMCDARTFFEIPLYRLCRSLTYSVVVLRTNLVLRYSDTWIISSALLVFHAKHLAAFTRVDTFILFSTSATYFTILSIWYLAAWPSRKLNSCHFVYEDLVSPGRLSQPRSTLLVRWWLICSSISRFLIWPFWEAW